MIFQIAIWTLDQKVMASRIQEFPVAREFPEPWEIPVTWEFTRLKLFPPVSWEMGASQEFLAHGFPLNIPAPGSLPIHAYTLWRLAACFPYVLQYHGMRAGRA